MLILLNPSHNRVWILLLNWVSVFGLLQIEYVRAQSKPKDGKLFAIGHSMGGILLYAMLSRCGKLIFIFQLGILSIRSHFLETEASYI